MKKRTGLVQCAIIVGVMMITSVSAQSYWGNWWWGQTANPLGLTTEQMEQIEKINIDWQKELLPLSSSFQTKSLELQRLMWDSNVDPAMVEEKTKEVGDLEAQMQRKLQEKRLAIREVLTDEQRSQYDLQRMGYGFGRGPCGLGLGRDWGRGFGWGRGVGPGLGNPYGSPFYGPGRGRGPCGMGLGRAGWWIPGQ